MIKSSFLNSFFRNILRVLEQTSLSDLQLGRKGNNSRKKYESHSQEPCGSLMN